MSRTTKVSESVLPQLHAPGGEVWPDDQYHRSIRRWTVRLFRRNVGSGSGILIGRDWVLTCAHVIKELILDEPNPAIAASEIRISPDISRDADRLDECKLYIADSESKPWLIVYGDNLDFAIVRLNRPPMHVQRTNSTDPGLSAWLDMDALQTPETLSMYATQGDVSVFMYHFPDPMNGSPYLDPKYGEAELPLGPIATWQQEHHVLTAGGSSGAMLFAKIRGVDRPFPYALHRGVITGTENRVYLPLTGIVQCIKIIRPEILQALNETAGSVITEGRLKKLAEKPFKVAKSLIDREEPAQSTVRGIRGNTKRLQPVFISTDIDMEQFVARLTKVDLPMSSVDKDEKRQKMRRELLCWRPEDSPRTETWPAWNFESVPNSDWQIYPEEAVERIQKTILDDVKNDTPILIRADFKVQKRSDYQALGELIHDIAYNLFENENIRSSTFLVLLLIDDNEISSERERGKMRKQLTNEIHSTKKMLANRSLAEFFETPLELPLVRREMVIPLELDVHEALGEDLESVKDRINASWPIPNSAPTAFDELAKALDGPLWEWLKRHVSSLLKPIGATERR